MKRSTKTLGGVALISCMMATPLLAATIYPIRHGLQAQMLTQEPINYFYVGNDSWTIEYSEAHDGLFIWANANAKETNVTAYSDNLVYRFSIKPSSQKHTMIIEPKPDKRIVSHASAPKLTEVDRLMQRAFNNTRVDKLSQKEVVPKKNEQDDKIKPKKKKRRNKDKERKAKNASVHSPVTEERPNELDEGWSMSVPIVTNRKTNTMNNWTYTVWRGDTLREIALMYMQDAGWHDPHERDVKEVMGLLFEDNKRAFINEDINLLMVGEKIELSTGSKNLVAKLVEKNR